MIQHPRPKVNGLPALFFWTVVWYLAAVAMDNPLLTAGFWQTVAVSIGRILLGIVCAVVLGCVLAVVTSSFRLPEVLIAPAMTAMQATPVASFTILVLIWIDRDFVPVLICGMMVLPVIFNNVSAGIRLTDPQLLEMAKVYKLPAFRTLRRI